MKKTSRVSRRRKSISGSRRYKKGKTANKKRVKRASSSTRRWISGGGDASSLVPQAVTNDNLDDFKKLIIKNLGNNAAVTIESTKLKQALPIIKSVIEFLQTQQIDVTKMIEIEKKINNGQVLTLADLLDLITFLYTNRNILKSGQIQLKPLFSNVVDLLIEKIPGTAIPLKLSINVAKQAVLALV